MTATVHQVFSDEHVSRLTGLTKWQLRSWDRLGFFTPRFAYEDRFAPYSRVYSFKDVVGLRTIAVLMKDYRASLKSLQGAAEELVKRGYNNWAELNLYVVKGHVHFQPPGTSDVESVRDGQLAMLPIIDVIKDVEKRVQELRKRGTDQLGRVERHKHVIHNTPVIAGTRIPTAAIRRFHEAGYSIEQIVREYPTLTAEDVQGALAYEEGLARRA
ncbi:MAG TPA: DUF433 domain-containing protein [Gemmataceae bacterium]|nr:DUF433 domain-containing protein [Gemmataceae bacterium]